MTLIFCTCLFNPLNGRYPCHFLGQPPTSSTSLPWLQTWVPKHPKRIGQKSMGKTEVVRSQSQRIKLVFSKLSDFCKSGASIFRQNKMHCKLQVLCFHFPAQAAHVQRKTCCGRPALATKRSSTKIYVLR